MRSRGLVLSPTNSIRKRLKRHWNAGARDHVQPPLTEDDPAWVGAWWIPFILSSIITALLSIPFFMFPRWLPDSHLVKKERAKEMARIYPSKYANEDSLTIVVKMFPVQILRLLTNVPFVFSTLGVSAFYIFAQGLSSFTPKYIESQFNLRASTAGLLTGGIAIPSASKYCRLYIVQSHSLVWTIGALKFHVSLDS